MTRQGGSRMSLIYRAVVAALVAVALAAPAAAQQNVTQADIQRLQDNVFLADRDIAQMRARDSARASQLTAELDELRDEVVYLKVKLRKERSLTRNEYADVRDRIEDVRTRAREDRFAATAPAAPARPSLGNEPGRRGTATTGTQRGAVEIPAGTEMDLRL